MCEPAPLQCTQCEKYKDGCHGQTGTFDPVLCPDIPCLECATCKQYCMQSGKFRSQDCQANKDYEPPEERKCSTDGNV